MNENPSAIIIGAGVGGIATAIYLAKNGYQVDIYEKNAAPGGRCGQMITQGYRFDLGATMLMMPGIYRRVFQSLGIPLFENGEVKPLDNLYSIHFDDNTVLDFTSDETRMKSQLEAIEPGSFEKSREYIRKGYAIFKTGVDQFIGRNFYHLFQFANFKNIGLLIRLKTYISNAAYTRKFFRNPHLRMAFTFQNIYVGQSPYDSPALFSMVPAAELTEGTFFIRGGMFSIVKKLMTSATENGVRFHFNAPVEKIMVHRKKAEGILLADGKKISADVIVANADLPYVYRKLLPSGLRSVKLDHLKYSCSALCFHWGLDKIYPQLGHHNVFLRDDYQKGLHSIFREKSVPENPCFYVHAPVRSDPSAAPEGHEVLSVIVGTGHLDPSKKQDWDQIRRKARAAVIRRLKQLGMEDVEDHMMLEICHTPEDWEKICNISRGSVFGSVAHNILQMGYFRPHNRHGQYKNLYFTGGSTHPGNGIPNVLLSAQLTAERILKPGNKQPNLAGS